MAKLSPHFALEELIASPTAERFGYDQTPPAAVLGNLIHAAAQMELVRTLLGNKVVTVSSGYRCAKLNRKIGGAKGSVHLTGHAIDFNVYGYGSPLAVCRTLAASPVLKFDQLIQEGSWVHISFDPRQRRQVLTKAGGGFTKGL